MANDSPNRNSGQLKVNKIHAESEPQESTEDNLEARQLDVEERKFKAEIEKDKQVLAQGILGKVFGDREHAPANIVAAVSIMLVLMFAYLAIFHESSRTGVFDLVKTVIIAMLGYFAGKKSAN